MAVVVVEAVAAVPTRRDVVVAANNGTNAMTEGGRRKELECTEKG